jgi:hypothetical protein
MSLKDDFVESAFYPALGKRAGSIAAMVDHVEAEKVNGLTQIIESGIARGPLWAIDAPATLVWDWVAQNLSGTKILSIDSDQSVIEAMKEKTQDVEYECGDAKTLLLEISTAVLSKVALLYLNSGDLRISFGPSIALERLAELQSIWDKLPSGCMVAVDDVFSPYDGAHIAIANFMANQGIQPTFIASQAAWIKT